MTTIEINRSRPLPAPGDAQPSTHPAQRHGHLIDRFGRRIDHLRLSVTDACDLKCCYCRPRDDRTARLPDHLTDEQRVELVAFLHEQFGLSQVRLTGGEALIYDGLLDLIRALRARVPNVSLALTTNARRLARMANALRTAGVERLNVSLDTINPGTYRSMTGADVRHVLDGLEAARATGFPPPRINSVVLRGMNDDEVVPLARWAMERGYELRFLEAMPIGPAAGLNRDRFVSASEIRAKLSEAFVLLPISSRHGATATRYRATGEGIEGVVGTIAPVSEPFCGSCRRIRLTAQGLMFPCLLQAHNVDLRPAWRCGELDRTNAEALVLSAVEHKNERGTIQPTAMIQLGG